MNNYIRQKDILWQDVVSSMNKFSEFEIDNCIKACIPKNHIEKAKNYVRNEMERYMNQILTVDFYSHLAKLVSEYLDIMVD